MEHKMVNVTNHVPWVSPALSVGDIHEGIIDKKHFRTEGFSFYAVQKRGNTDYQLSIYRRGAGGYEEDMIGIMAGTLPQIENEVYQQLEKDVRHTVDVYRPEIERHFKEHGDPEQKEIWAARQYKKNGDKHLLILFCDTDGDGILDKGEPVYKVMELSEDNGKEVVPETIPDCPDRFTAFQKWNDMVCEKIHRNMECIKHTTLVNKHIMDVLRNSMDCGAMELLHRTNGTPQDEQYYKGHYTHADGQIQFILERVVGVSKNTENDIWHFNHDFSWRQAYTFMRNWDNAKKKDILSLKQNHRYMR